MPMATAIVAKAIKAPQPRPMLLPPFESPKSIDGLRDTHPSKISILVDPLHIGLDLSPESIDQRSPVRS